jgi:hypothetical protein
VNPPVTGDVIHPVKLAVGTPINLVLTDAQLAAGGPHFGFVLAQVFLAWRLWARRLAAAFGLVLQQLSVAEEATLIAEFTAMLATGFTLRQVLLSVSTHMRACLVAALISFIPYDVKVIRQSTTSMALLSGLAPPPSTAAPPTTSAAVPATPRAATRGPKRDQPARESVDGRDPKSELYANFHAHPQRACTKTPCIYKAHAHNPAIPRRR